MFGYKARFFPKNCGLIYPPPPFLTFSGSSFDAHFSVGKCTLFLFVRKCSYCLVFSFVTLGHVFPGTKWPIVSKRKKKIKQFDGSLNHKTAITGCEITNCILWRPKTAAKSINNPICSNLRADGKSDCSDAFAVPCRMDCLRKPAGVCAGFMCHFFCLAFNCSGLPTRIFMCWQVTMARCCCWAMLGSWSRPEIWHPQKQFAALDGGGHLCLYCNVKNFPGTMEGVFPEVEESRKKERKLCFGCDSRSVGDKGKRACSKLRHLFFFFFFLSSRL